MIARKLLGTHRTPEISPSWARLALAYERHFPNHRGKRFLLRRLYAWQARSEKPLVRKMENGAFLAVHPIEGLAAHRSVGWTCFQDGVWEPHVERVLREILRPGDTTYDVGANLGYFSAVMAQCVRKDGCVAAFEPVPQTFELLQLCRELNDYPQLLPFPFAIGAERGMLELALDPRLPGDASAYRRREAQPLRITAIVHTLDELVASGQLPPPSVVKIDVEGHEFAVLQRARNILAEHRPALVFEIHGTMSRQAGWKPTDISDFLCRQAPYRFFHIGQDGVSRAELGELSLPPGDYLDVLALT